MVRWKTIGDPDTPAPKFEPGMAALVKEIRSTVSQEAQIVKAVFPDPAAVLQVFLQRVFAQVVRRLHLTQLTADIATSRITSPARIIHINAGSTSDSEPDSFIMFVID
jgi:hypothetical protein